ncbi:DUF6484 domain-containing protein [Niveibacterium sp. SC-1]|uniref:DUF6484 domain-containing protein n=1 Tax=Niveibacterium sp. SC-1 TaxID=3135646 RepID=UPI00311E35D6
MQALDFKQGSEPRTEGATIQPRAGWIAEVTRDGEVRVDYPGNRHGVLAARSIVDIPSASAAPAGSPTEVLLCFEAGDPQRPIIMGILRAARIAEPASQTAYTGEQLSFTAGQEMSLRCGDSSITLTADGRIVIKGRQLVSRASETNKIRGASVAIN